MFSSSLRHRAPLSSFIPVLKSPKGLNLKETPNLHDHDIVLTLTYPPSPSTPPTPKTPTKSSSTKPKTLKILLLSAPDTIHTTSVDDDDDDNNVNNNDTNNDQINDTLTRIKNLAALKSDDTNVIAIFILDPHHPHLQDQGQGQDQDQECKRTAATSNAARKEREANLRGQQAYARLCAAMYSAPLPDTFLSKSSNGDSSSSSRDGNKTILHVPLLPVPSAQHIERVVRAYIHQLLSTDNITFPHGNRSTNTNSIYSRSHSRSLPSAPPPKQNQTTRNPPTRPSPATQASQQQTTLQQLQRRMISLCSSHASTSAPLSADVTGAVMGVFASFRELAEGTGPQPQPQPQHQHDQRDRRQGNGKVGDLVRRLDALGEDGEAVVRGLVEFWQEEWVAD